MTRRLLLASKKPDEEAPVAPPGDPHAWPAALDATHASIRPTGRRIGALHVGPDQAYATISAAVTAGRNMQVARGTAEGFPYVARGGHPDFRVDILVHPGTYAESISTNTDMPIVGITGNHADVIVTGALGSRLGCLESSAGGYVEGITFQRGNVPGGNADTIPKYPQHHSSGGRNASFVNCHFDSLVFGAAGGWTVLGSDGSNGSSTLWYACKLTSGNVTSDVNVHGFSGNTVPSDYMYVNMDAPTVELSYDSLHASLADRLWVVGGTCLGISTSGAGTVLHYTPESTSGTVSASGPSDTNTADWPVPVGNMTTDERASYYP